MRSFIERIERRLSDKQDVADDITELYREAKGEGFQVAIMRKIVALRKKSQQAREEEEQLLELYMSQLELEV